MNMTTHRSAPSVRSGGYALITVLLFMMLATMLAVTSVKQVASQERLAANYRAWTMALMGAEAAARAGERWLLDFQENTGGSGVVSSDDGASGVYGTGAAAANTNFIDFMRPRHWSTAGATELSAARAAFQGLTGTLATAQLAEQPRYMIEDLGRFRPPGAGKVGEGGVTGNSGYEGSAGMSPAGNADLRVFRVVGKSTGPSSNFVATVQSIYAGRIQN